MIFREGYYRTNQVANSLDRKHYDLSRDPVCLHQGRWAAGPLGVCKGRRYALFLSRCIASSLTCPGYNYFTISTSLDLQRLKANKKLASDAQRRVFITVNVKMKYRVDMSTSAKIEDPVVPQKNRAYEATVALKHRIVLCITAGSAGKS